MDTERCILYFGAYYTTITEEDLCEALLAVHFLMDFLVKKPPKKLQVQYKEM